MNQFLSYTNQELVSYFYYDLACKKIRLSGIDFIDMEKWYKVVNSLSSLEALVYRICIFDSQVTNGGLIQYFDNRYGIFAYETSIDFNKIKAYQTQKILEKSLSLINPDNLIGSDFVNLISKHGYNYELDSDLLSDLDQQYYSLVDVEDLELLVSNYLRENIASLE